MTYARRKRTTKPKDILILALRNLLVSQEITCTPQTYDKIKDRVDAFCQSRKDLRFAQITWGNIRKIKRIA